MSWRILDKPLKNSYFLKIWLFFHCAVFVIFLASLFFKPKLVFSANLFDILPISSELREVQKAEAQLSERMGRNVSILVKSERFEDAKNAAESLYARCGNSEAFESISLFVEPAAVSEIVDWLHKWRFNFLPEKESSLILSQGGADFITDSLSLAFGAFTLGGLSRLDTDPFMLSERNLRRLLDGGIAGSSSMALKDDVLATQKDGFWYVLVRAVLSKEGASLTNKNGAVRQLYDICGELSELHPASFVFSGIPFHSYESATSAQRQISVISSVGMIAVLVIFLLLFRSLLPAVVSAVTVAFSCLVGFTASLLFFRGIHVLTFVFGTTLIGISVDYAIHFFVHWKADRDVRTGAEVRTKILRGIGLGFASTEICFAALFVTPYPLLRQVSVFLFFGLLSSFLCVIGIYPILKLPKKQNFPFQPSLFSVQVPRWLKLLIPAGLLMFVLFAVFCKKDKISVKNNISSLYSMSDFLFKNEKEANLVLNTGSSGWYFIVKADTKEKLLEREQQLALLLERAKNENKLENYLSYTQFVPSAKSQLQSYEAVGSLGSAVPALFAALGYDEKSSESACSLFKTEYENAKGLIFDGCLESLPSVLRQIVPQLFIGEIDDSFYSCVLPLHVSDAAYFKDLAADLQGIYFVDKVSDISAQMDVLTLSMIKLLAISFVVVVLVLLFVYSPVQALKVAAVPLLVFFVTVSILLLSGIGISFFPATALVLVFGLGLDYSIYAVEGSGSVGTDGYLKRFAILLSFVTTALSFGALALSSFVPVHILGLTVFVGLTTAVLVSLCICE